ncbi:MAG TPA: hypothetical protein PLX89_00840 [Verrucomicrobiota bacterium]|nr:hypothetical protein [Verrucomicrobiales bacterium]HRI11522.1 hypothetical protein [Verrucomicrobiota bacterium]
MKPPLSYYQSLIDSTTVNIVKNYFNNPRSEILTLVHVKHEADLAKVAQTLSHQDPLDGAGGKIPTELKPLVEKGELKLSYSDPKLTSNDRSNVDSSKIPGQAECSVIYAPPFYVMHTPGLFEWHDQQQSSQNKEARSQSSPSSQQPSQSKSQEQGR